MKKNIRLILILVLALTLIASTIALVACKKTTVTLTVDYGLSGVDNSTWTVDIGKPFNDNLVTPESEFVFGGWFMEDGSQVTESTVAPDQDFTVKARWIATYSVQYWLEKAEGVYELSTDLTIDAFADLGSTLKAEIKEVRGYVYDEGNPANVTSAILDANGVTLKLYYKRSIVTVNFDKLIASASGSMAPIIDAYGVTVTLPSCGYTSGYTFVGWNTSADGTGASYADGALYILNANETLYAQWQTSYTVTSYKEEYVNDAFDTEYTKISEEQKTGIFGHNISIDATNPDSVKYVLDQGKSVISGALAEDKTAFTAYFSYRIFEIRYATEGFVDEVKYGSSYTVRTAANDDPNSRVQSYCTSSTGNGRDYAFGATITNVIENITLYQVILDVYVDDSGSGVSVEIRRNMTGMGSAVLIIDGVRYEGEVGSDSSGYLIFEVEVDGVKRVGRPYVNEGDNLFTYRGDEYGVYVYYDYIFGNIYADFMLSFDGFGMGVMGLAANDGTERWQYYYLSYEYNEDNGDYDILYYNPSAAEPEIYQTSFNVVPYDFGEGYEDLAGYFMEWNVDGEYYEYVMYDNQQLQSVYLYLDGYGNALLYETDSNDEVVWELSGMYTGSEEYYYYGDQEYVFWVEDEEGEFTEYFHFVYTYVQIGDSYIFVFITRNDGYGLYAMEGATGGYPALYLDGYGYALYMTNEDDDGRVGTYTISEQHIDGTYHVFITFIDDIGGVMYAIITLEDMNEFGMNLGSFTLNDSGFVIDDDGVLTQYVYDETVGAPSVIVIPEGVKEIAAQVFSSTKGFAITSVTFPESLEKIGDYAFACGDASGGSPLQMAIFLGTVPPELGEDVFRWIKGSNLKIIVPEGAEEAYRTASSWTKQEGSQSNGYAQFVTTWTELANKPEFEVKDGVLVSYNNKDEDPSDVHIVIPDDVVEIAYGVFTNLTYITSVDLKNVKTVGDYAFFGCTGITKVIFGSNIESIGEWAFYNCYHITSVDLGGVKSIGACAFSRCIGLTYVIIGDRIESIGDKAFYECGRDEYYVLNRDGEWDQVVDSLDLVVTISATTAPTMGKYIFDGSQPRLYVNDYDTVIAFASADTWAIYAGKLRLKTETVEYWYSISSDNGWLLELGDILVFNGTYIGWYKWEGNTLYVTWAQYSQLSNTIQVVSQTATLTGNELKGLNLAWDGGVAYTFVKAGTTLEYGSDDGEIFSITLIENDGVYAGSFNGNSVEVEYVNYRLWFNCDGYRYLVYLQSSGSSLTFYYTREKITVVTTYKAEDGSTLTVYDGVGKLEQVYGEGVLNDVDGKVKETLTSMSWGPFTKIADNIYCFNVYHLSTTYRITVYLNPTNNTFTYEWSVGSIITVYRDSETGDLAIVTRSTSNDVISIHIVFKTSNGTEEQIAKIVESADGVFTVVINGTVDVEDEEGYTYQEPSTFNGTYTLTLDDDNLSFTLVKISSSTDTEIE